MTQRSACSRLIAHSTEKLAEVGVQCSDSQHTFCSFPSFPAFKLSRQAMLPCTYAGCTFSGDVAVGLFFGELETSSNKLRLLDSSKSSCSTSSSSAYILPKPNVMHATNKLITKNESWQHSTIRQLFGINPVVVCIGCCVHLIEAARSHTTRALHVHSRQLLEMHDALTQ